jgi:hypothetical protein
MREKYFTTSFGRVKNINNFFPNVSCDELKVSYTFYNKDNT